MLRLAGGCLLSAGANDQMATESRKLANLTAREDVHLQGVCCIELARFAEEGPRVWLISLIVWASLV